MHDPMVVAFEIPMPIPKRNRWRERAESPRWSLGIARRTNPENLGERVYPWWRPKGYQPRIAGRCYGLRYGVTVWHVEPGGRDAFTVCKHSSRWKWHVWHWHLQIHLEQALRRWLFERCVECGRRYPWGYAPVSHQWDAPKSRWFHVAPHAYHHECSGLVSSRHTIAKDERLIRALFAAYRTAADLGEAEALALLTDPKGRSMEFGEAYRLTHLIGYERTDDYDLVRVGAPPVSLDSGEST